MAFTKIQLTTSAWTKIGDNVTSISFQNASTFNMYVAYTAADVAPTETIGVVYPRNNGELKQTVTDLTHVASAAYVWARPVSGSGGSVLVETGV